MNLKSIVLSFFFHPIFVFISSQYAFGGEFREEEKVYIIGSLATIHAEPRENAPAAAKLPIGTKATFKRTAFEVATDPDKVCKGAEGQKNHKWSCVCIDALTFAQPSDGWCGWIATDFLDREQPKLSQLLDQYDKTPPDNLPQRRKWAERAASLDPISNESRSRLLDVLERLQDTKALEAARRTFESYSGVPAPYSAGAKLIFQFNGDALEPFAELNNGELVIRFFDARVNYAFRNRGQIYNIYSRGRQIGTFVTEAQFDCKAQMCPTTIIGRSVLTSGLATEHVGGLATNFIVPQQSSPFQELSKQDEGTLQKMANAMIDSLKWDTKTKKAFRQGSGKIHGVGTLSKDGRVMLIGNWEMGSMNYRHYGSGDEIYESLLIIAEQQADGSFRLGAGSGSIADFGCSYFDRLDIDDDGTDEIFLSCSGLEGSYSYATLKRKGNKWVHQHDVMAR